MSLLIRGKSVRKAVHQRKPKRDPDAPKAWNEAGQEVDEEGVPILPDGDIVAGNDDADDEDEDEYDDYDEEQEEETGSEAGEETEHDDLEAPQIATPQVSYLHKRR